MRYRHYKGEIYTYICDAFLEWHPETHVIVYEDNYKRRWVMPRVEFFGYTSDGQRRFEKIIGA